MWQDPIVEEIRQFREQYAIRFNHDLRAICRDLRDRQKAGDRKVVTLTARRIQKVVAPGMREAQPVSSP